VNIRRGYLDRRRPMSVPPIISGLGKATNFKFGTYIQSVHANKSPLKIWEKGAWVNPGTPQIFGVPPIISGMGKVTNFKFGRCIQRAHTNKSRLKIWEKLECGRIQGLPKFFQYPLLSQQRIKLRTSNLAGIFIGSIRTKAL